MTAAPRASRYPRAEAVVASQLDAYNARDIDAFMAAWHDDAQILAYPGTMIANGAEEIRARHLIRFRDDVLAAKLRSRTCVGDLVVDHETVTRSFAAGPREVEVVGIYQVENGRIRAALFRECAVRVPLNREPFPRPPAAAAGSRRP
jgi:putative hydrolase of HD superfamily